MENGFSRLKGSKEMRFLVANAPRNDRDGRKRMVLLADLSFTAQGSLRLIWNDRMEWNYRKGWNYIFFCHPEGFARRVSSFIVIPSGLSSPLRNLYDLKTRRFFSANAPLNDRIGKSWMTYKDN